MSLAFPSFARSQIFGKMLFAIANASPDAIVRKLPVAPQPPGRYARDAEPFDHVFFTQRGQRCTSAVHNIPLLFVINFVTGKRIGSSSVTLIFALAISCVAVDQL